MKLSKKSIAYLSEALQAPRVSGNSLEKICDKIEVDPELSLDERRSWSIENRLWALIKNLNGSDKLDFLVNVIITEYGGRRNLSAINNALKTSGYVADASGNITSYMGEQVQLAATQSKIESTLHHLGFKRVLTLFDQGLDEYGKGHEFQALRTAIIGLVEEILLKEKRPVTKNMRDDMNRLFDINVLNNNCKPFTIGGQTDPLELVHAYGIFSLLSEYLAHYGDLNEEEKHFIFFQSVGLFWLITERYMKFLETKK